MSEEMTLEEAKDFFASFYCGDHHIPGTIKSWGYGWTVIDPHDLSTFDFDNLTRLVFLAHDRCVRVSVMPCMRYLRIAIWKRVRDAKTIMERHPDLSDAVEKWRKHNPISEVVR